MTALQLWCNFFIKELSIMVRNKAKDFPVKGYEEKPHAKAKYSPMRANGTINIHPQERMAKSSRQNENEVN
jgi:small acid-soluble spore protein K (minor)